MIEFIINLILFPFTIMGYLLMFIGYFLYVMLICFVWFIQLVVYLVSFIFALFSHKKRYPTYKPISFSDIKISSNKQSKKYKEKQSEFDREADLWGLSEEDRRIAKEERMSPADYVEAEERDDDELFTDEWE